MDLLGRKMRRNNGALFMAWLQECNEEIERAGAAGFSAEVAAMEKARDSLGGAAMHLGGLGMQGNVHGAMLHARRSCRSSGPSCSGSTRCGRRASRRRRSRATGRRRTGRASC